MVPIKWVAVGKAEHKKGSPGNTPEWKSEFAESLRNDSPAVDG